MSGMLGAVSAGPAEEIEAQVREPWTRLSGRSRPVPLPHGLSGRFYPGQGIAWSEGGWRYEVVSLGPIATSPGILMPLVRRVVASLGSARNPVGPGTRGYLFQGLAPDNAAITLYWTEGSTGYEVWGYAAPAIRLAQSLVQVPRRLLSQDRTAGPRRRSQLWQTHSLAQFGVDLAWPSAWRKEPRYQDRFGGAGGFVEVSAASGSPLRVVQDTVAHPLHPFGTRPMVRRLTVAGHSAYLMLPSADADQLGQPYAQVAVAYRRPVVIAGYTYRSLLLWVDVAHVERVAASVRFLHGH